MSIKENMKNNKKVYKILKPMVDRGRMIEHSLLGFLRKSSVFCNQNYKELKKYRNLHKGQRCFVIANGPSLTMEDLELVIQTGDISFGCNHIEKIFENTAWRPDYWCVTDENIADSVEQGVPKEIPLFTTKSSYEKMTNKRENICYIKDLYLPEHCVRTDMMSWWAMSATVSVFMIELAMYMGFSEIVLLGLDCTFRIQNYEHVATSSKEGYADYSKNLNKDKERLKERNMTADEYNEHIYQMFMTDYRNIQKVAQVRGIKIVNATRGGRLEVYKRQTMEEILK